MARNRFVGSRSRKWQPMTYKQAARYSKAKNPRAVIREIEKMARIANSRLLKLERQGLEGMSETYYQYMNAKHFTSVNPHPLGGIFTKGQKMRFRVSGFEGIEADTLLAYHTILKKVLAGDITENTINERLQKMREQSMRTMQVLQGQAETQLPPEYLDKLKSDFWRLAREHMESNAAIMESDDVDKAKEMVNYNFDEALLNYIEEHAQTLYDTGQDVWLEHYERQRGIRPTYLEVDDFDSDFTESIFFNSEDW